MSSRWTSVVTIAAAAAAFVAATVAASRGDAAAAPADIAAVRLQPTGTSTARGVAYFRQRGRTLSGWVAVWNLEPNSHHAVHFHGPGGSCRVGGKPPVAAHPDLVADERGVAFTTFRTTSDLRVLRGGFYYNVHALPLTASPNPEIACGNVARAR